RSELSRHGGRVAWQLVDDHGHAYKFCAHLLNERLRGRHLTSVSIQSSTSNTRSPGLKDARASSAKLRVQHPSRLISVNPSSSCRWRSLPSRPTTILARTGTASITPARFRN